MEADVIKGLGPLADSYSHAKVSDQSINKRLHKFINK